MRKKDLLHFLIVGLGLLSPIVQCVCPQKCTCDTVKKFVNCRNAGLSRIPWNLPDPSGIRQLDLRGNKIKAIIAEVVSYVNLEYLDLSGNQIIHIADNVLDAMPHLKFLLLQNNQLSALNSQTFQGLGSLLELDLSNNNLDVLEHNVFRDLPKLEDLKLGGNVIGNVKSGAFVGLSSLKTLSLNDNRLKSVPTEALRQVPTLQALLLDHNHIGSIQSHAFKSVPHLRKLSIESNDLSDVADLAFHSEDAAELPRLQILLLKNNRLRGIPTNAITSLADLVKIDLSQNPIETVEADSFKSLNRLRTVNLVAMPELTIVRNYAFSGLADLSHVELHSNRKLNTIEKEAFVASINLKFLDLHANALKKLYPGMVGWNHLETLDLRFNPWRCDCHLQWMNRVLKQTNASRLYAADVFCESPFDMAARRIIDIKPSEFVCIPESHRRFEDRIMIGLIAGISGLLVVVMGCLMYKHKYSIFGSTTDRQVSYHIQHNIDSGHTAADNSYAGGTASPKPDVIEQGQSV